MGESAKTVGRRWPVGRDLGKKIPSSPVPNKESWSSQDLQSTCQSHSGDEPVPGGLTNGRLEGERGWEEKDGKGCRGNGEDACLWTACRGGSGRSPGYYLAKYPFPGSSPSRGERVRVRLSGGGKVMINPFLSQALSPQPDLALVEGGSASGPWTSRGYLSRPPRQRGLRSKGTGGSEGQPKGNGVLGRGSATPDAGQT